jgi:hypothetical protein
VEEIGEIIEQMEAKAASNVPFLLNANDQIFEGIIIL